MNALAAAQAEERIITKPPEWAVYMVTAALKCASDEKLPATYASHDEAKYSILKSLNWLEAHDAYVWPDFTCFNYDFSQVVRLRRAHVQDVCNALEKAGNVSTTIPSTPDSSAGGRQARRLDSQDRRLTNTRKRLCRREAEADEEAILEESDKAHQYDDFLLEVMTNLNSRSKVDVSGYIKENGDPHELANMLHDSLVDVWTKPQQEDGEHVESLKQKADIWDRYRLSLPPRPSQRERTSAPRVSSTAPHASPGTVQKSLFGPAPADASGGWTAANINQANTDTIG